VRCESRMADLPILYSFRRCPYAMRARIALLLGDAVCEIREVVLRDKPAEMIALSPKATVPVLLLPDGRVIDQSLDIMRWALTPLAPSSSFPRKREPMDGGASDADRSVSVGSRFRGNDEGEVVVGDGDTLITTNDGPFKHHLDRYKYPDRHDGDHLADRAAGIDILSGYEQRLERQPYLLGDIASLADFAIFPFVRQFAAVDQSWFDAQPLPKLQTWLAAHIASPLFERAMVRLPAWHPGDPVTLFPGPA
jgi:glutathione S-transferase